VAVAAVLAERVGVEEGVEEGVTFGAERVEVEDIEGEGLVEGVELSELEDDCEDEVEIEGVDDRVTLVVIELDTVLVLVAVLRTVMLDEDWLEKVAGAEREGAEVLVGKGVSEIETDEVDVGVSEGVAVGEED